MNKHLYRLGMLILVLQSCATKKEILYFQDVDSLAAHQVKYETPEIQPNDILSIQVSALIPETALPYNKQVPTNSSTTTLDLIKLQGYLVSPTGHITFPVLGKLHITSMTTTELEAELQQTLEKGGHLLQPTVSVRLLNAKVTILGEVNYPGTYTFTEQQISLPQALGYAGDLTINGKREDVLLIREEAGIRTVTHIDMTATDWFDSAAYYIRPNDFIVINPNGPKIKSAGFIGNTGTLVSVLSVILTSIVLITK